MGYGFGPGKSFLAAFLLVFAPYLLCTYVLGTNKRKNGRLGVRILHGTSPRHTNKQLVSRGGRQVGCKLEHCKLGAVCELTGGELTPNWGVWEEKGEGQLLRADNNTENKWEIAS